MQQAQLASKFQETFYLPPRAGITDVHCHTRLFYVGAEGWNLGPHVYVASTLPSEPSSQLIIIFWSLF